MLLNYTFIKIKMCSNHTFIEIRLQKLSSTCSQEYGLYKPQHTIFGRFNTNLSVKQQSAKIIKVKDCQAYSFGGGVFFVREF